VGGTQSWKSKDIEGRGKRKQLSASPKATRQIDDPGGGGNTPETKRGSSEGHISEGPGEK